jgi:hypothetical protein
MKLFKTCPILTGIVVITIALTAVSYARENTIYEEYSSQSDVSGMPHFVLALKAVRDGVYPWSQESGEEMIVVPDDLAWDGGENGAEAEGDAADAEPVVVVVDDQDLLVSGNSVSGNDISGNDSEEPEDKIYELTEVSEDYFDDALFIGDSRTVGLSEYCTPLDERATFYAKVSLTIYDCMKKQFVKSDDGKITIDQALQENQFGKIYIMLGLNEVGTGTPETFAESYLEVVQRIRELQPDALIFIQGIMHVTAHKSDVDKYFNNDNINRRNEALSELADNKTIFYIDMNEATDDEDGNLLQELSFDDVHLKASSYERWYQYLLGHGIIIEE